MLWYIWHGDVMQKKSAFSVDKPEASLGYLLWRNTTFWQRNIKAALMPYDISHAQFVIMAAIRWYFETKQVPTQISIAQLSGLDKMTVSKSLKKLASLGLVARSEDVHDTRAKTVVLSAQGNKLIKRLIAIVDSIDEQFFGVLNDKDKEMLNQLFCELDEKNSIIKSSE